MFRRYSSKVAWRHERVYLAVQPPRDHQGFLSLGLVRLAGCVEIAEEYCLFGQAGGFAEYTFERRLDCHTLLSQFPQVMCLAESHVVESEKGLRGFLGRLLAMKHGYRWLSHRLTAGRHSDPY